MKIANCFFIRGDRYDEVGLTRATEFLLVEYGANLFFVLRASLHHLLRGQLRVVVKSVMK